MAGYLIGHISVKHPQLWREYVAGVGRSLAPWGAEVIFRGRRTEVLAGDHSHEQTVVIRFDEHRDLLDWYRSPAYQALIPLRDRAADVVIVAFDEA